MFQGRTSPTPEEVENQVDQVLSGPFEPLRPQRRQIIDLILERISIRIGASSVLEDNSDHEEWLKIDDSRKWRLWNRLHEYLHERDKFPPSVLAELDESTNQALRRLESPQRVGRWNRRGLVVGHVQSGKTTHYTALAAKAFDAGYQIVIVLAGIHNSLRSQTHERIDRYLIGKDSAAIIEALNQGKPPKKSKIGVGELDIEQGHQAIPFDIHTCTSSADNGDFHTSIANQVGLEASANSRLMLVVKKNAVILRNLTTWLLAQNSVAGKGTQIAAPTLVIDDEADHASVNTHDPDEDPTTINRLIRKLLHLFSRVGFVGYTATPFANIFIAPDRDDDDPALGPDLFPKAFIVNLQAPTNYIGPDLVFGHPGDDSVELPPRAPLPMHVSADDSDTWLPEKHKKDYVPGPLPKSLREALRLFVLNVAVRRIRADGDKHNSMLVHATRFVDVQKRVVRQLQDELDALRNCLGLGSPASIQKEMDDLHKIWTQRVAVPHAEFRKVLGDRCLPLPGWKEVQAMLREALRKIKVNEINGTSADTLAYSRSPDALDVVAVGGDKLSRGLTLEGLSVSYFLRTSKMYDTLMQMGRWFGYRPRYADLCRVYTTHGLHSAFREIALATEELREDLDRMARANLSPEMFGLRVRAPSDGLLITAANKIREGKPVKVRFADSLVQALEIARTGPRADENRRAVENLLGALGPPSRLLRKKATPHFLWAISSAQLVVEFLEKYEAYSTPSFFPRCEPLVKYIRERVLDGELKQWTVALVSKNAKEHETNPNWVPEIAGLRVPLVTRIQLNAGENPERFRTQAIVGSAEEALDLGDDDFAAVVDEKVNPQTGARQKVIDRLEVRKLRPPTHGLLLIYPIKDVKLDGPNGWIPSVAISFPRSDRAKPLEYTVNEIWQRQHGLTDDVNADE